MPTTGLWNALEKLAVADPDAFIDYHRSDAVAVACEAWLGPRYQLTEQVNVVNPGGEAQHPHRDYHMGFLTDGEAEQFPLQAHLLSPLLTLQGAIAHCDMGTETGPTMYLPHSHKYELGYLAWRRPEFIEYFSQHRVQLPLRTGDAVFFSPAMFHAAGHNRTADVHRIANLLQISSAFGRATEAVDRARMVNAVYPTLRSRLVSGLDRAAAANVVAACAEAYAFPTNLDRDQPVDGLAPPSQADLMNRALDEDRPPEHLRHELEQHGERHRSAVGEDDWYRVADAARAEDSGRAGAELAGAGAALVGGGMGPTDRRRTTVAELLAEARSGLRRLGPDELAAALEAGSGTDPVPGRDDPPLVIDIRDRDDRERTGMIPGSVSNPAAGPGVALRSHLGPLAPRGAVAGPARGDGVQRGLHLELRGGLAEASGLRAGRRPGGRRRGLGRSRPAPGPALTPSLTPDHVQELAAVEAVLGVVGCQFVAESAGSGELAAVEAVLGVVGCQFA